jgi:hypothetical protein
MSDFKLLNQGRVRSGPLGSDDTFGFTGAFLIWLNGCRLKIIASDELGWQHVSVSLADHPATVPRWDVMCAVKDLFWEAEDCVCQFHPPKSQYVNRHKGCLHLWRCTDGREQPMPPKEFVG